MIASRSFVITNWFVWIVEAHHAGMSDADIKFVLHTLDIMEQLREALQRLPEGWEKG